MRDAWILARNVERAAEVADLLAEFGFSPYNLFRGPFPVAIGKGVIRLPDVLVLVAGPGEPAPERLGALEAEAALGGVALVVAVESEHLGSADLVDAHELLVWPFSGPELWLRIRRAVSLVKGVESAEVVSAGSLELNLATHSVTVEGVPVELTHKEYGLLELLMTGPGRTFSREAVLMQVWGCGDGGARTVDVHLSRLRAKLGDAHGALITTIRGVGYVFRDETAKAPRARRKGQAASAPDGRLAAEMERWIEKLAPGASCRPELRRRGSALGLAAAVPSAFVARGLAATLGGTPVRIGFLALTDAASVIMAHENRCFEKRGIGVQLVKQASWRATCDALLSGEIDAAHCLFSLPLAVATGIAGVAPTNALKVAMMLDQNGQAITLKQDWAAAGYDDLKQAKHVMNGGRGHTYAMTFPGGTHDTWLRYWLKAMGIELSTLEIIQVPPPEMVAKMRVGTMDGFCVGEPWNGVAAQQGIGFTELATQDLWEHHPEKALVVSADFAARRTDDLRKVIGGILEASQWLDQPQNRARTASVIGRREYVNAPVSVIHDRLNGTYKLGAGLGTRTFRGDQMRFFRNGRVNFPRRGHAIWFLAQYVRFGYLAAEPSYAAIARDLILSDLYKEVADAEGYPVPNDDMEPFEIKLDGVEFDPRRPEREAARI